MGTVWILRLVLIVAICGAAATPVAAQNPAGFEARAEYLLRMMDAGLLPTPMLIAMLDDPFPETRVLALRVVASSLDPSQTPLLREYLGARDLRVRYEVMVAAGRLGPEGRDLAFRGLGDGVPKVRQAAAWAAAHGGDEAFEPLVTWMAQEQDIGVLATAIANLWRFDEAGWEATAATAAGSTEVQLRRAAAYSLARSERPEARAALRALAADAEPVIRATAITGLRRAALAKDDFMVVTRALTDPDPRVQTAVCAVLAEQSEPPLSAESASLVEAMWAPVEPQLAVMAIRAAGARPEIGSDAALLQTVGHREPWLASEALAALVRRDADGVDEIATEWLSGGELWRIRAVAMVAPEMGEVWERTVAGNGEASVRLAWLEDLTPDQIPPRIEVLRKLVASDPDPVVRAVALNLLSDAKAAGGYQSLLGLARSWASDEMPDARAAALVAALAVAADDEQQTRVLELATLDRNPAVAVLVINAARSAGLPARSQTRDLRHNSMWYLELVDWMQASHWLDVSTDRGTFRIRLDALETPITAREVSDLAAAGFYDGLEFHRVVPNFVVQGGDPRGDGWGGPGFILPDEPAFSPFDAWRVGIATAGPNTGGSQFFVTLMPADHLVGHYTNFGEVVAGREVLTRLRVGDRIRLIEVFSGDEPPPPTPVLLGEIEWGELAVLPGWRDEYDEAEPDLSSIERLSSAAGSYRIVTVLGSWCHDSRREVPRLVKILDVLDSPAFSLEMVGVDRTRRIDDAGLAASSGVERTVDRVATIVVFDADGNELGRVVETPERPIEELLVEFISPAEGWQ